ncbi:MAG: 30S ribosome-binding factor RbfA [bacterium]|nr:30S ribosome-binding factor RbfA [bacterium]
MAKPIRIAKINAEIVRTISKILTELNDPEIANSLITVTRASTSEDFYQTKVYVSIYGDEAKKQSVLSSLEKAKGKVRRELALGIDLRIVPEIIWVLDDSLETSERINKILEDLKG